MANELWSVLAELKSPKYRWVDLTHELSPDTPALVRLQAAGGYAALRLPARDAGGHGRAMRCIQYSVASQYGTHVDAPRHFHEHGRTMAQLGVKELVMPLVVIDKSAECAADPDFMLRTEDIQAWEAENGRIPEGAFVAFRSDWYNQAEPR